MHYIRHKYKLTSEDTVTTALRESNMADALCLLFGTGLIGSALVSVGQGLDRAKYIFRQARVNKYFIIPPFACECSMKVQVRMRAVNE